MTVSNKLQVNEDWIEIIQQVLEKIVLYFPLENLITITVLIFVV